MESALYRKYRPSEFKDVVGQDHIVKPLSITIKNGNISHAYLFAGSRGIGKTSIARIFAKDIGTSANDIYEIDGASNRGIDDVRALREAVNTLPFDSKYKVYIIDECHMLTKEAFNALLKTLEEPPKHVIFILATTEIDKLPTTIVSRCEVHQFRKPTQKFLKDTIEKVSKKEGFSLEPASSDLIALLGDGSFRDALGILQKIIGSSADKKISIEEVELVTGAPRESLINDFVLSLSLKDLKNGLLSIKKAVEQNVEMKVFVKLILRKMRFVLLLRFAPEFENTIKAELSLEDFVLLNKISADKSSNINSEVLKSILEAHNLISYSALPELPLELAVIKICEKVTN